MKMPIAELVDKHWPLLEIFASEPVKARQIWALRFLTGNLAVKQQKQRRKSLSMFECT